MKNKVDYSYNNSSNRFFVNERLNCKSLAGNWRYKIDEDDEGISEKWYRDIFKKKGFILPGTMAENALGNSLDINMELSKETVNRLRPYYEYIGVVWYQRKIMIPETWCNKKISLFLERVIFQSMIWIDDCQVGSYDSLSVPHVYEISDYLKPGKEYQLTIRIDNRDVQDIDKYSSAYTDATQTIWNGIVGDIRLNISDKIFIKGIQVYPCLDESKAVVKVKIGNNTKDKVKLQFRLRARSNNTDNTHLIEPLVCTKTIARDGGEVEFDYYLGNKFLLWDEFNPAVYKLIIEIESRDKKYYHKRSTVFGMRKFRATKNKFKLNNRPIFLRGTLDCCVYPLTGYPPTDVDKWLDIFNIVKNYGLNHVRFHSWCPPEAAFIAADLLGIYLQVEGPVWLDNWNTAVGEKKKHYDYLPVEAARIIEYYGNHPSFMLFSNGNELNGDFDLLHDIIKSLKNKDDRHLYSVTSNWDRNLDSADDFFIAQSVDEEGIRGQYYQDKMAETTDLDFEKAVSLRDVPVVSHEIGQYSVYPDITEIFKYNGILRPINFEVIKDDLIAKKMVNLANKFTQASGKLAVQLYRDEIEAALKTKNMAGFQLLNLHDFPGQSTATVGILNSFWESKGLIEPEKFRECCSPTVLLLRMGKRVYTGKDNFNAGIEIAHYGEKEINDAMIEWVLRNEDKSVFASGVIKKSHISTGQTKKLGEIKNISFAGIKKASKLTVELKIKNTKIKNNWNIWFYPEDNHEDAEIIIKQANILIATKIDEKVEKKLANGGKVLLLPDREFIKEKDCLPTKFYPVFWSPVHFESKDPCGILCDANHKIFDDFPTDSYASYQWKNLLENSFAVSIDSLSEKYIPIITVVPNYFYNKKLANLFEANVEKGKMIICTLNIKDNLEKNPVAGQLRKSILSYMSDEYFKPGDDLKLDKLKNLLEQNKINMDNNLDNIAIGKKAVADSAAANHGAENGNNGRTDTYWIADDKKNGHWWQVDLGGIHNVEQIKIMFREKKNYKYVIMFSQDNKKWVNVINETGQIKKQKNKEHKLKELRETRYIRIIYNNLPANTRASHYDFRVYEA